MSVKENGVENLVLVPLKTADMTKEQALEVCKVELVRLGHRIGTAWIYDFPNKVYASSFDTGGPATYGHPNCWVEATNYEDGRGWLFAVNNRYVTPRPIFVR